MDSFDGAYICQLVGFYIQSNLENILPKTNFGLYKDDVSKWAKKEKLLSKFPRKLLLVLTFKQILKK